MAFSLTNLGFFCNMEAMLQSALFTKTRKETPADEVSKNAILLTKASFINKEMSGVYSYLPLGLRVLKKIEHIIRDEMNLAGGQEILMPTLHPKENWEQTGRWKTMDDLFKVKDASDKEFALGPTHEEIVAPLLKQYISSYKDLPKAVYQIQNKFRMELRAKSGLLRGREFIMKDMYSFHRDEKDLKAFYEKMKGVYKNVFDRAGIGHLTYLTFASGGSFSKYSHEFQAVTPAGEDLIYIDEAKGIAVNKEVHNDEVMADLGLNKSDLVEKKAIEVGNIFELKTKFSAPFDLAFKNDKGEPEHVVMGCYGIGLGRLMGTVVEVLADEKGMIWPKAIAPFTAHVISLGANPEVQKEAEDLYQDLTKQGIEVLFDDRQEFSAGEKFADADLIGIPWRIVVSDKSLKAGGYEIKGRTEDKGKVVGKEELVKILK